MVFFSSKLFFYFCHLVIEHRTLDAMQSLFNSWDGLLGDAIMTRVKHTTLRELRK
jgi:hypothetical protein